MKGERDYTVFIAEDEHPARELLVEFVLSLPGIKLGGIARSGDEAVEKLNSSPCDILLLDIDLPVYSGIEVIDKLNARPRIIFTTAFDNQAVRAFEIGADDYLVKPFTEQRFAAAIERSLQALRQVNPLHPQGGGEDSPVVMIREKGIHYIIPVNEIIYLSSNGRNSVLHTINRDYETGVTLSDMTGKLASSKFIRIHKQYTVNIMFASHFSYYLGGQYILFLRDDDRTNLPVGKTFADDLKGSVNFK